MLGKSLIQAAAAKAGAAGGLGIEDVFSTWLYTGNSSTQTITNGIDLAGEGGIVWTKCRQLYSGVGTNNCIVDTVRGGTNVLVTNNNQQNDVRPNSIQQFNSDGYTVQSDILFNYTALKFASWTFRKAPGFFDVVTWVGNGASGRTIPHALGSVPGCIIVKNTSGVGSWQVWHRSLSSGSGLFLNLTDAATGASQFTALDQSTQAAVYVGNDSQLNSSGQSYVAYLFAHDEQIFGEGGDQSVIKCGSYTGNGSTIGPVVDLGWEPQWLLIKNTSDAFNWWVIDSMRGFSDGGADSLLAPNIANAEISNNFVAPTSTGFRLESADNSFNQNGSTFVYIAIRRGPMKTPTSGTEVFYPDAVNANAGTSRATGFPVDLQILRNGRNLVVGNFAVTRLTGVSTTDSDTSAPFLRTYDTSAESNSALTRYWDNSGYKTTAASALTDAWFLNFRRAPGFFDVVAYTGTGAARTVAHNLGVAPELIITKSRNTVNQWLVTDLLGNKTGYLNQNSFFSPGIFWTSANNSEIQTTSISDVINASGNTYITYLFATLPGISKVFSFTGNGTSQTIDCGFAAGARFVLLKRTDSAGNWLVADTARGIISGNDPLLYLNSTAAEITTLDWIDPHSSGFIVNQEATANANVGGATYIGLAIA